MQAWTLTLEFAGRALLLTVSIAILAWGGILFLRRTEDPAKLIFKWIFTAIVLGWLNWEMETSKGFFADLSRLWVAIAGAFILTATWRHNIADAISKPFGAIFDGGDQELEPRPYYSVAESKRKKGRYHEAVAEIRKQLKKFPNDFEGQMMLAGIQAENLNDLPGAELVINRLCAQRHAPVNIAHALITLADWHLKYEVNRDAARQDLQRIVALLPDSEHAVIAAQRIAHLGSNAHIVAPHDRARPIVREGVRNLGLLKPSQNPKIVEADHEGVAADYVKHLEDNPLDFEAREKLALIYADYYRRLDLATDQMRQLIEMPGQAPKKAARWLNLLADVQVRLGADYETVKQTLEEILTRYPHLPSADVVRTRLSHLKLEFKGREITSTVKMGEYEQNIGLKNKSLR